ncbi:MAG: hypothetical protein N2255_03720, partial [Kiritimatiellae bacterium]|nr:hypothetical protein [Kiritimatiellia bacterium]
MRELYVVPFAIAVALGSLTAAESKTITTVIVRNPFPEKLTDFPVTLGQVFKKGDAPDRVRVLGNFPITQVDIKRRHPDGSVRFAIISVNIPELLPKGEVAVGLAPSSEIPDQSAAGSLRPADLLKTNFDVVVTLKFPDGVERSASARQLLEQAGENARVWIRGPVATEWLLNGSLNDKDGQPDPDLRVQFHVRSYSGGKLARVSVVVENCLDTWGGNIRYDVAIRIGKSSQPVYQKSNVHHRRSSRWRKIVWWPAQTPDVAVVHDLAYLCDTGAIPNYDRSVRVDESVIARLAANWATSRETDIMGSGSLTKYMPTTGGRPEIGPYPTWAVRY